MLSMQDSLGITRSAAHRWSSERAVKLRDGHLLLRSTRMNQDPLDPLLEDYARRPLPGCPDDLRSGVWLKSERRRRAPFLSRAIPVLEWRELFSEPRVAVAALVCALAIGAVPGVLAAKAHAEQQLARHSFHFDVFSTQAPNALAAWATPSASPVHGAHP